MAWLSRVLKGCITGVVALACTSSSPAADWLAHRRPTCPPYDTPCFGYHFTTWRTWPNECAGPEPSIVVAPVPSPTPTAPTPRKDQPAKGQSGKNGSHQVKPVSQGSQSKSPGATEEVSPSDTPPSVFLLRSR